MKKSIKYTIVLIIALVFSFVAFFFWASSESLTSKDYTKVLVNNRNSEVDTDSIYSIVTYNIGYLSGMTNNRAIEKPALLFETNLKAVKRHLKQANADILALQEIDFKSNRSHNVNQQNEIATLGYKYVAQAINWDKNYVPYPYWPPSMHFGKILSGQSVLSKYPIHAHDRKVLQRVNSTPFYEDAFYLERLAQVTKIEIDNKELIVINIHLEAFDKKTRIAQLKDVIALYNNYSTKFPTILLGDFNSDPDYEAAGIHLMFAVNGVACAAFSNDNYENTFSSNNPYERLDYIFYNTAFIEYVSGEVLADFGEISDHLPVKMTFKFK